ncbi:MAG: hypothetical protein J6X33_06390 [Clostridiales bacterium]|nr:hypothetical protein [Clostridiales bacterium]
MAEVNNMQNDFYTLPPKPAAPNLRGGKLSLAAMIMGIVSYPLSLVSLWAVFWLAYGRENMLVIRIASFSILFAVMAVLAIILGIIAKKLGSRTSMLIVTLVTSVLTIPVIALNVYILIYYIGMTY